MDIRKLQRAIVDGLEDVKAQNIAIFNTEHLSPLFERVIIASGTSNRQTKALASSVRETVKKRGMDVLRTEGEDNGEWIIVDCGAAVAHILQPAIREYYNLEEIWGGKAVRMKVGEVNTKLVKASEPEPRGRARPASAKAAGGRALPAKTAAAKTAVGKSATGKAASTPGAGKPPARKSAGSTSSRVTDAQKQANRTAAFKRVAAKSPARKTAAGKTGAKAGPAKAPARKPAGKP